MNGVSGWKDINDEWPTNLHEKEWNANFSPFEASYHRIFKNARVTATPKPDSIQPAWTALYTYVKE